MKMAGPREAIQHMIIRKNYGATHFIIGRDMAGTKSTITGDDFYGPYDAQEMGNKFEAELGMTVTHYENMVYVGPEEGYVQESSAKKAGKKVVKLSGTEFRRRLRAGEEIPEWFAFKFGGPTWSGRRVHSLSYTCNSQVPYSVCRERAYFPAWLAAGLWPGLRELPPGSATVRVGGSVHHFPAIFLPSSLSSSPGAPSGLFLRRPGARVPGGTFSPSVSSIVLASRRNNILYCLREWYPTALQDRLARSEPCVRSRARSVSDDASMYVGTFCSHPPALVH